MVGEKKKRYGNWFVLWLLLLTTIGLGVWQIPFPGDEWSDVDNDAVADKETKANEFLNRQKFTFYLPNDNFTALIESDKKVPAGKSDEEKIRAILGSMFSSGSYPFFSEATIVREVFAYNDTAVVSIDSAYRSKFFGGLFDELLTVASITNSITANFKNIKKVQFLVDDTIAEKFVFHIDISEPVLPDISLNKKEKQLSAG